MLRSRVGGSVMRSASDWFRGISLFAGCGGVRGRREAPAARGPIAGPRAAAEPRLSHVKKLLTADSVSTLLSRVILDSPVSVDA